MESNYAGKISLRAPEPEDLSVMAAVENDESMWEVSTTTGPYSRYQLKAYLESSQNDVYADRQLRLMIEHDTDGTVGMIDLCSFDPRHNRAEVGIVVLPGYRRKGVAREALRLMEAHCFNLLGIHQLYAYVLADNTACLQLFLASGYNKSGCLTQWIRTGTVYKDVCIVQKFNPSVE